MYDLSFCTSEQLVQELLRRTTFVGIVIRSEAEAAGRSRHKTFRVECSDSLAHDQAVTILDELVGKLKK